MIGEKVRWYEPNGVFTMEEKFSRVLDSDACRDAAYRNIAYYNNEMRAKAMDELWVQKPENRETASYGAPWGFYVGMDAIRSWYVDKHNERREEQLAAYKAADPSFEGGLNTGVSVFRTINTPVIYIAEDGKTAQGCFFIAGEETLGKPDGTAEAFHIFGRVGVDYMNEDGEWKIWHWAEVYDFTPAVGELSCEMPTFIPPAEQPFYDDFMCGKPTIDMITHYPCCLGADGWPAYPCAHKTYNLDNSYAPEGHPGIRTDVVDVNWNARVAKVEAWGR